MNIVRGKKEKEKNYYKAGLDVSTKDESHVPAGWTTTQF